jgi:hypothetical protein
MPCSNEWPKAFLIQSDYSSNEWTKPFLIQSDYSSNEWTKAFLTQSDYSSNEWTKAFLTQSDYSSNEWTKAFLTQSDYSSNEWPNLLKGVFQVEKLCVPNITLFPAQCTAVDQPPVENRMPLGMHPQSLCDVIAVGYSRRHSIFVMSLLLVILEDTVSL